MYFKHHNKASELKKVRCCKLPEPCSLPGLIPFLKRRNEPPLRAEAHGRLLEE